MCGIVGYIGFRNASDVILDGLTRLEYRGYDSAGITVLDQGEIWTQRSEGKLIHLKNILNESPLSGKMGIGHTRWATHGKPSQENAHPHRANKLVLVHNGIIENYQALKDLLQKEGRHFSSETDTEVLAHWIDHQLENPSQNLLRSPMATLPSSGLLDVHNSTPASAFVGAPCPRSAHDGFSMGSHSVLSAISQALAEVRGSYAIAMLHQNYPQTLYAARRQSPLVIGLGENENFIASDVPALLPYTRKVIFLEDGDLAEVTAQSISILNVRGELVTRPVKEITWTLAQAEKEGYPHFMLKEIFETPRAFIDTFRGRAFPEKGEIVLDGMESLLGNGGKDTPFPETIHMVACGTSFHAALLGKFYFEKLAKTPVTVDVASEFRYRPFLLNSKNWLMTISQSGETADTLMCVKNARQNGTPVYSICNVIDSSIARESSAVFYTHAGPEIGVAATKTLVTQIEALLLIALDLGKRKNVLSSQEVKTILEAVSELPQKNGSRIESEKLHFRNGPKTRKISLFFVYWTRLSISHCFGGGPQVERNFLPLLRGLSCR